MLKLLLYLVMSILSLAYDARPLQSQYAGERKPNPRLRRRLMPVPVHATPHATPHSPSHSTSRSHPPNASKSVVPKSESHKVVGSSPYVKDAVRRIEDQLLGAHQTPPSRTISPRVRTSNNEPIEVALRLNPKRATGLPNRKVDPLEAGKKLEDVPKIEPPAGELTSHYSYEYPHSYNTYFYPFEKFLLHRDNHGYPKIPEGYNDLIHDDFHSYIYNEVDLKSKQYPKDGIVSPNDLVEQRANDLFGDVLGVYEGERHGNMKRYNKRVDEFITEYVSKDFRKAAKTEHQLLKDRAPEKLELDDLFLEDAIAIVEERKKVKLKKLKKLEKKNEQKMREGQQVAVEIPHSFEYWRIMDPEEYVNFARELHDPSYPGYNKRRQKTFDELKEANQELKEQQIKKYEASILELEGRPNHKEDVEKLVMDKIRQEEGENLKNHYAELQKEKKREKKRERKDEKKRERKDEKKREQKDEKKREQKDEEKREQKDEKKRERKDEKKREQKDEKKREQKDEKKRERKDDRDGK